MCKRLPSIWTSLLLSSMLAMTSIVFAQDKKRPKESTILLEKIFIEANREKLLGNIEEAIQRYWEVLQKDNTNAASNYELARLYQKQEDWSKASLRAARAVELQPKDLIYNKLYAKLLEREGNYKKAAELYANLSNAYPAKKELYTEWAYYLTKSGKADQAIKVYNSLEKRVGIREGTSMRKYKLYMKMGKDKKASQEIEQLIEAYPKEPEYIIRLANFYASMGDLDRSKSLYKQALTLDPNNPTANMAMVEFFLQSGDTTRYLNALINTFDNPNQELLTKVETLKRLVTGWEQKKISAQHTPNIIILSEKLAVIHPNSSMANALRGDVLYKMGAYTEAALAYEKALLFTINDLNIWQQLLESLHKSDQQKKLQKYAQRLIDVYPSQAISYYYNGIANYQKKALPKAIIDLKEALVIDATNMELEGNVLRYLAKIYEAQNDIPAAEKAFNEAILMDPKNLDIIHDYAYSLIRRNTALPKAATLLEGITNKAPKVHQYTNTQAWLYYKQGNYKVAKELLDKNLKEIEKQPTLLERYGDVLFKLGQTDAAVQYWQKALDNGSEAPQLPQKISTRQLYE
ncbi:MAG: tetratricopeptide repeat protein [Aureispira sp.]